MGNKISYLLKPFLLVETDNDRFRHGCIFLIEQLSGPMLRINAESTISTEVFTELNGAGANTEIEVVWDNLKENNFKKTDVKTISA